MADAARVYTGLAKWRQQVLFQGSRLHQPWVIGQVYSAGHNCPPVKWALSPIRQLVVTAQNRSATPSPLGISCHAGRWCGSLASQLGGFTDAPCHCWQPAQYWCQSSVRSLSGPIQLTVLCLKGVVSSAMWSYRQHLGKNQRQEQQSSLFGRGRLDSLSQQFKRRFLIPGTGVLAR